MASSSLLFKCPTGSRKAGAHLQVTANQLHGTGLISIPIPTPQKWELHGLKHTFPEKLKANLLFLLFPKFLQHHSGEPLRFRDWVTR